MRPLRLVALAAIASGLAACSDESTGRSGDPIPSDGPSASATTSSSEATAQTYVDALVGTASCDEVWELVVSDGETKSEFCPDLAEYRGEVRSLTLGDITDSTDDYTIFAVRVDYRDGSPPVLDSELEVDVIDGETKVALGLP